MQTSHFVSFPITDFPRIKWQVLNWANQFNTFCFLDNHDYRLPHHSYECLLAAGASDRIEATGDNALDRLQDFSLRHPGWLFGHLGFEVQHGLFGLTPPGPDPLGFPGLFFFVPEILIELQIGMVRISSPGLDPALVFRDISAQPARPPADLRRPVVIRSRIARESYLGIVEALQRHLQRGDCYEINFCQEFYAEDCRIDPLALYGRLSVASPAPFAAYYRLGPRFLICASPERFLKREASRLISQPIKGTRARVSGDPVLDGLARNALLSSSKERSENIMVVDLVRNDLSRVCEAGTVRVEELMGIYSFPQVHQMVSTVVGQISEGLDWTDLIRATFPMGSMTGAPKKRVLELISAYEAGPRGLFSGALGYRSPGGDFDFNVVIRSLLYHPGLGHLSFPAGSAITSYSEAEQEYEECLVKAAAIKKVLAGEPILFSGE